MTTPSIPAKTRTLARDITAEDLAMDSPDPDEGHRPGCVIGPAGTVVTVVEEPNNDGMVLVADFANDPDVEAYVAVSDLV